MSTIEQKPFCDKRDIPLVSPTNQRLADNISFALVHGPQLNVVKKTCIKEDKTPKQENRSHSAVF